MKTLIICKSIHHQNTQKIAKQIATVLKAEIKEPEKVGEEELKNYDLIGFGSGIYGWRHHKSLLKLADNLSNITKKTKKAFIFSTNGRGDKIPGHLVLKKKLEDKGFKIIDEFSCKGFDTFGPLKLIGGINKGKPDEQDLKEAKQFAKNLVSENS